MTTTLYIKDFAEAFYYAAAVKDDRPVKWRKHPVTHQSVRYRMLMSDSSGRDAYSVFLGIVDLVCRHKRADGALLDANGRAITPQVVAASTGIPASVCRRAFEYLQTPDVAWLTTEVSASVDQSSTKTETLIDLEQSRAERSRLEAECSAKQEGAGWDWLRSALLGCGLTTEQVETMLAHENADDRKLRYAVARWNEDRAKGRPTPRYPARWIERVAEIRTTNVPEKLAARKSEISRQADALRTGMSHVCIEEVPTAGEGLDVGAGVGEVAAVTPRSAAGRVSRLPPKPSVEGQAEGKTGRVSALRTLLRAGNAGTPQDVREGGP